MDAIVVTAFGSPAVLRHVQVAEPRPGPGEVVVRVRTSNVNFADIQVRRGAYAPPAPPPFVPGLEATGVVDRLGPDVRGLKVGQRVVAFALRGSYSRYMLARATLTYPLPDDVADEQIAGLTAAVTAQNVLHRGGGNLHGKTVLVHAAAGGVGSLAVQLAKAEGAEYVIGTVGRADKAEAARKAGADAVVVREDHAFAHDVMEVTTGAGVDLALNSLGGETVREDLTCIADFGTLVTFGQSSGEPGNLPTDRLFKSNRSVVGYSSGHLRRVRPEALRAPVESVLQRVREGALRIPIGARFPLAEAAAAHDLVESRRSSGKILLAIGP